MQIRSGKRGVALALAGIAALFFVIWGLSVLLPERAEDPDPAAVPAPPKEFAPVALDTTQRVKPDGLMPLDRAGHDLAIRSDGSLLVGVPQGINRDPSTGPGYVAVMSPDPWTGVHRIESPSEQGGIALHAFFDL